MEEKIFFKNSRSEKLVGLLADVGKEKIAILCHGHSSGKSNKSWTTLVPMLNAQGISTFRFDFYGNGESDGKFEHSNLSDSIDATLQAIKLIKDKGFNKIILVGSSFGGLSSTITASKSKDLYALILKSPVSDYGEVHLKRYGEAGMAEWQKTGSVKYDQNSKRDLMLNFSFVEDYKKYDAYEAAKQIKIPTLIVHGEKDQTVPLSQSQKLITIIPNAKLTVVQGADHSYTEEDKFQEMIKYIADFIQSI